MDNEQEVSVQDLISLSYDQKPVEFQDAFNSLIGDKIAQAVQDKKMELAQSVFNPAGPDDHGDDDDDNAEVEDEFDDFEDEEAEDDLLNQEDEENGETA
jgi:hypothetical protein